MTAADAILLLLWTGLTAYSSPGPQPTILHETDTFRALVAGLEPGGRILRHPEPLALYHVLEGTGTMLVDGEHHALRPGATVIVPAGASRRIEAATRLAFLAVRVGPEPG